MGVGEYRADKSLEWLSPKDVPPPEICFRSKNYKYLGCPRCREKAVRLRTHKRRLFDLGNRFTGRPRVTILTVSQHVCRKCNYYFTADVTAIAVPKAKYTKAVVDIAVPVVVEDGLSYENATWHVWRDHRVLIPPGTIQNWVEASGKKRRGFHQQWLPRYKYGSLLRVCRR